MSGTISRIDLDACRLNGRSVFSAIGFEPGAHGLARRLIRQREEEVYLVLIERRVALGTQLLDDLRVPTLLLRSLDVADLEIQSRDDDGGSYDKADNDPGHVSSVPLLRSCRLSRPRLARPAE